MSKSCSVCKGRGRWQEAVQVEAEDGTHYTQLVWKECGSCQGTGISQDPEDGDPFDIGGSSYAEE